MLLSSCSKDEVNPCFYSECSDTQTCIDGKCTEYSSLESPNFINQPKPSKILLSNFIVEKFPFFRLNGTPWDANSKPDLFIQVTQGGDVLLNVPIIMNAESTLRNISLDAPIEIINFKTVLTINVFEDDGNRTDEFMGGVFKEIYSNSNGYPDVVNLDLGGPVGFQFDITYQF